MREVKYETLLADLDKILPGMIGRKVGAVVLVRVYHTPFFALVSLAECAMRLETWHGKSTRRLYKSLLRAAR